MGLGKVDGGEGELLQKYVPGKDVTIALFFDGTKNNKYNITERKIKKEEVVNPNEVKEAFPETEIADMAAFKAKADAAYEKTAADSEDNSYDNNYSNIALLYDNFTEDAGNYVFKVYVEGQGTEKFELDDGQGYAFGSGTTGIPAKVEKACRLIIKKLDEVLPKNPRIVPKFIIDVFGFSRGAAAARHFVYEISKAAYKPQKKFIDEMGNPTDFEEFPYGGYLGGYSNRKKIDIDITFIRFAGLYDTVASYSYSKLNPDLLNIGDDTKEAFKNDTEELHLDTILIARQIVHFTANDEHRANFSLTKVTKTKRTFSFGFPGVHSDVGGGYNTGPEDVKKILVGSKKIILEEREKIINQAWYKESELTIEDSHIPYKTKLNGYRNEIDHTYSFIPLHFMCKKAIEYTRGCKIGSQIAFDQQAIEADNLITGDVLVYVKKRLEELFNEGEKLKLREKDDELYSEIDEKYLRELRNKYLHWNSHYQTVPIPYTNGYIKVTPMYPRLKNDERVRLELPLKEPIPVADHESLQSKIKDFIESLFSKDVT